MCSFARNEHNLLTPNGLPCQVKQLVQKLEALEADVAEHEARQQVELTTVKEELETERVLRAQVQELRQETTADKEKAEERAKEIQGRLSEIEGERVKEAATMAELRQTLQAAEIRAEEADASLSKQADDLSDSQRRESAMAGKLRTLQATLRGVRCSSPLSEGSRAHIPDLTFVVGRQLEEEWGARETAADAILAGLKADFERAKGAAERAETARGAAQAEADESARATQEEKRRAASLAEDHKKTVSKLELDTEAYRRSESLLQQKLTDLATEFETEKQRHARMMEEQSSMHMEQVKKLMEEVNEHQRQQTHENTEQLVAQRQLMVLEEQGLEERKASLKKQQDLELAVMQASNKVRELKELLRVSITREARSASSSRELSQCVKALREKLLERDDECAALQHQVEEASAAAEDQTRRHDLALSSVEVKLTAAQTELATVTETLQRTEAEAAELRGEMSAKVATLTAAVEKESAAALNHANKRVLAMQQELDDAESAVKVKDAVCKDQAASLQQTKEEARRAESESERNLTELEDRTK